MKNNYIKALILVATATLVFIADLLTKYYILDTFGTKLNFITVTKFLNIVYVNNYGISFGLLSNPENSKWMFIILSATLICVLLAWYIRSSSKLILLSLAMIIGGALGNLYDRLLFGSVLDFIDFHYATLHYPAFNVADSFIVIGVILLIATPSEKVETT